MKRIIFLLLCCFMVSGCQNTRTEPVADVPQDTIHAGLTLVSDNRHSAQLQLNGAVQIYVPSSDSAQLIGTLEGNPILAERSPEKTVYSLFSSSDMHLLSRTELPLPEAEGDTRIETEENFFYYSENKQAVFGFDAEFHPIGTYSLPEECTGIPSLSPNFRTVYFPTKSAICALDTSSGISRVLTEVTGNYSAVQTLFDGTALFCMGANRQDKSIIISPEDGRILYQMEESPRISTVGNHFAILHSLQKQEEILMGQRDEKIFTLYPGREHLFLAFLPEANQVITYRNTETGLTLDLFGLDTGKHWSEITLPDIGVPTAVYEGNDGRILMQTRDTEQNQNILLQWKPQPVTDSNTYRYLRYTEDAPDSEGLRRCRNQAEQIRLKYGIPIRIYKEAAAVQPWDYKLEAEYLVPQLTEELEKMDTLLGYYPEGFLKTLSTTFDSLQICLVRSITGTAESGSLATADGLQFWQEKNGYIALAVGTEIQYNLFHEISHLIDTQVINQCSAYDNWDDLNPPGFQYRYDFTDLSRDASAYLQDADRAFIDPYAMSFPAEDRARIMEYAMNEGNDSFFRSPIMQEKLKQMCIGIRKAFGLTKAPEKFRWEQYLDNSLAYKEWT